MVLLGELKIAEEHCIRALPVSALADSVSIRTGTQYQPVSVLCTRALMKSSMSSVAFFAGQEKKDAARVIYTGVRLGGHDELCDAATSSAT